MAELLVHVNDDLLTTLHYIASVLDEEPASVFANFGNCDLEWFRDTMIALARTRQEA